MDTKELIEFLERYNAMVAEQLQKYKPEAPKLSHRSEGINELTAALSKAQGDYKELDMNDVNPYSHQKYALLNDIMESVQDALSKNNLAVVHSLFTEEQGHTMMYTELLHVSGQWIQSSIRIIPPLDDMQAYESMINDNRKIALMALLNITAKNDPMDDDGERAMQKTRNKEIKGTALDYVYDPKAKGSKETVSKDQLDDLEIELDEWPDIVKQIYKQHHISSLADLPRAAYRDTVDRVREIKKLRQSTDTKD